jgi:opacity protein-like surface antigen
MSERATLFITIVVCLLMFSCAEGQEPAPASSAWLNSSLEGAGASATTGDTPSSRIWNTETGEGFARGAQELGFGAGVGLGMKALGGGRIHNWALGMVQYGYMLSDVVATNHWYRGNWELMGEAFGGEQFNPNAAYFVGAAPLVRYNFACSRWLVPFVDVGAGLAATDIRNGDLSTTYEFTVQGAAGVRVFLNDSVALVMQYRYIHISNASIHSPNLGVNVNNALLGLTWFF